MRAARATQLRCRATVAFSGFPGMARFNGSLQRLAVPALGLVELVGWMGRVGWEGGWIPVPAWTRSSEKMRLKLKWLAIDVAWIACKGKRSRVDKL